MSLYRIAEIHPQIVNPTWDQWKTGTVINTKPSPTSGYGFIRRGPRDRRGLFFHFSDAARPRMDSLFREQFTINESSPQYRPRVGDEVAYVEYRDSDGRSRALIVIPAETLVEAREKYDERRTARLAEEERERRSALEKAARHAALAAQPPVGCDLAGITIIPGKTPQGEGQLHLAEAITRYAGVAALDAHAKLSSIPEDTLHFWSRRPWRECGHELENIASSLSPAGLDRLVQMIPALCTPGGGQTRQAVQEWARTWPITWLLEQIRPDLARIWSELPTRFEYADAAVRVAGCRFIAKELDAMPRTGGAQSRRIQRIIEAALVWVSPGLRRQTAPFFVGGVVKAVADAAPEGAADRIEAEFLSVIERALNQPGQDYPGLWDLGAWQFYASDPESERRPCRWTRREHDGYMLACARWEHAAGSHLAFVADGAEPVWGACAYEGEELPVHFCHLPQPGVEQVTCLVCGTAVARPAGKPFADIGEEAVVVFDDDASEEWSSNGGKFRLMASPWRRGEAMYGSRNVPPYMQVIRVDS